MYNKINNLLNIFTKDKETIIKFLFRCSIALDLFLILSFVIGFSLGMISYEIGFFIVGIVYRYGFIIFILSILLNFITFILSFHRNTAEEKRFFSTSLTYMFRLLFVAALLYGIYYIGKVMTAVG